MKKCIFAIGCALLAVMPGLAQTTNPPVLFPVGATHEACVWVNSQPPGATLTARPIGTEREPVAIGKTPCVIMANLSWQKKLFRTRWRLFTLESPGDAIRAVYDRKNYELYLDVTASMPGYITQHFEAKAMTLPPPGLFWERTDEWPTRQEIVLNLTEEKRGTVSKDSTPAGRLAPASEAIVMGQGSPSPESDLATIMLSCTVPDASIFVDGIWAGTTPVQLVLQKGRHTLAVTKEGYRPFETTLDLSGNSAIDLKATLEPEANLKAGNLKPE